MRYTKACFGTKESIGRSLICRPCKFRKKCKTAYSKKLNKFRKIKKR